jgi:hypothetical protein
LNLNKLVFFAVIVKKNVQTFGLMAKFSKEPSLIFECEDDLETHFLLNEYKTRNVNTSDEITCTIIHDTNFPKHTMITRYKKCVSNKCHGNDNDICKMKKKVIQCMHENKYYVFEDSTLSHNNKYPNATDIYRGIHPFYIREIRRIYRERALSATKIYLILEKNFNDNAYDKRITIPTRSNERHLRIGITTIDLLKNIYKFNEEYQ